MLTGMEVANASMYDGPTAAAEAVLMAHRITKRRKAVLAGNLHPHYRATIETVSAMAGDEVVALPPDPAGARQQFEIDAETSCVVVQFPDFYGHLPDLRPVAEKAHAAGALLLAVVTGIVSPALLIPPSEIGTAVIVARLQSLQDTLSLSLTLIL